MDATQFLNSYDGNDEEPAKTYYLNLVNRIDADIATLDLLNNEVAVTEFESEIAHSLIVAERIAYRFQHQNRKKLYDGAIFVEDDDHFESILSPYGTVSTREDWKDQEIPMVVAWLKQKYSRLERHFVPPDDE
jgi:hypothetical protein